MYVLLLWQEVRGDGSEGAKSAPCALAAELKARHRLRCRGLGRKRAQEDSGVAEMRGLTGGSSRPRCDREEGDQGLTRGCLGQLTFASPDPWGAGRSRLHF